MKNYKAFTIIEVVVSLLIASLILAFAAALFFAGERMTENAVKKNQAKLVGDNVLEYLSDRIEYCSALEIKSGSVSGAKYDNVLYISSDNYLGLKKVSDNDDNIFGKNFYSGFKIRTAYTVYEENCVKINVDVMNENLSEKVYTVSNTVKLSKLDLSDSKIETASLKTELQNPIVSYK